MALIKCPECNKEISNKANMCPNCGFPLDKLEILDKLALEGENNQKEEDLICPKFPKDITKLWIGKMFVNWMDDTYVKGFFDSKENVIEGIPTGKVKIFLHKNGIRISKGYLVSILEIHNSQIISLKHITEEELIREGKSVIGRAVIGHLLLGPLGAIIGGMSGIGPKEKLAYKNYLVINFWDIKTRKPQSMLLNCNPNIGRLIERHKKESKLQY